MKRRLGWRAHSNLLFRAGADHDACGINGRPKKMNRGDNSIRYLERVESLSSCELNSALVNLMLSVKILFVTFGLVPR